MRLSTRVFKTVEAVGAAVGTALMSKANYPKFVKRFLEYNALMSSWDEGGMGRE